MNLEIKKVGADEILGVVKVHNNAFLGFFLASLGDSFLKLYYKSLRNSKGGLLLGAYKDNELVGFIAGTDISAGHNKRLVLNNFFSFCCMAVNLLFKHPKALPRLMLNLEKRPAGVVDKGLYSELTSMGVLKTLQGLGIGQKLIKAAEQELILRGKKTVSFTTDFHNNDKAQGLYDSCGYKQMYVFTSYPNRKMIRYIKQL